MFCPAGESFLQFPPTRGKIVLPPPGQRSLRAASNFQSGPGIFGDCTKAENFDHILLSPALFALVTGGTIYRMGAWGGTNGTLWPHYPTLTQKVEAASDHAAVYVETDLQ